MVWIINPGEKGAIKMVTRSLGTAVTALAGTVTRGLLESQRKGRGVDARPGTGYTLRKPSEIIKPGAVFRVASLLRGRHFPGCVAGGIKVYKEQFSLPFFHLENKVDKTVSRTGPGRGIRCDGVLWDNP